MSKKTSLAIKFVVSALLVAFLIWAVDWRASWELVRSARVEYLLFYFVFVLVGIGISARKWQLLAEFQGFREKFFNFFTWYIVGTFFNNFFPSFIGGDGYRSYSLGNSSKAYGKATSTVVVDRLTGLLVTLLLAAVFSLYSFSLALDESIIMLLYCSLYLGSVLVLGLWYYKELPLADGIKKKIPQKAVTFLSELRMYLDTTVLTRAFLWSLLFCMLGIALANFLLFEAIDVRIDFFSYLSMIFLISIISSLPISVGNWGVKEWAYIYLFGFFGVTLTQAVTVVLLGRFLQMLISLIGLPFYLKERRSEIKEHVPNT
jgi:uncharacterized protein (TIRG00374 family)